jgi:uncharacterized protein YegJ (DUF2314 family)
MLSIINLTCQTFVERRRVARAGQLPVTLDAIDNDVFRRRSLDSLKANAKKSATLRIAKAEREEGDADNRLVEIAFPGPEASLQVRHQDTIARIYGATDEIHTVEHDAALEAASKRARARVMKLKSRFEDGPPLNEELMVKAPFPAPDGGNEWMWVEVATWKGKLVRGVLQNDPFLIPDLKGGARVEIQEDVIFDYIWTKANGEEEGNETGKLLSKRRGDSDP